MQRSPDPLLLGQEAVDEEAALYVDAAERGVRYLRQIRSRKVFPDAKALSDLQHLRSPLPEVPQSGADVLEMLDRYGSPATVATSGARYFGFVCGGALPAARAASVLAAAWDQTAAMRILSPVGVYLEDIALEWLLDILGLPATCGGSFVTGSTVATLVCLTAARHRILSNASWDVEENGLFGAPAFDVYVSRQAHSSVRKALSLIGLGRGRVVEMPTDRQGRVDVQSLPHQQSPAIICIQAGDVNTGSFDPAREICEWARRSGSWVHVDGAFGLWAAASPTMKYLVSDFALADSWATDGHKWLNIPYDTGFAFVRDAEALRNSMSVTAPYLQFGDKREPTHWTPELSRRARGIEVWTALRSLGRRGLAELVERCCCHARRFASRLTEAGYQILNDVVLNQVLVSFGSGDDTLAVIGLLQDEGTCWCGSTTWQGTPAMRISVTSWATSASDVDSSVEAMIRIAKSLKSRQ